MCAFWTFSFSVGVVVAVVVVAVDRSLFGSRLTDQRYFPSRLLLGGNESWSHKTRKQTGGGQVVVTDCSTGSLMSMHWTVISALRNNGVDLLVSTTTTNDDDISIWTRIRRGSLTCDIPDMKQNKASQRKVRVESALDNKYLKPASKIRFHWLSIALVFAFRFSLFVLRSSLRWFNRVSRGWTAHKPTSENQRGREREREKVKERKDQIERQKKVRENVG